MKHVTVNEIMPCEMGNKRCNQRCMFAVTMMSLDQGCRVEVTSGRKFLGGVRVGFLTTL